MDPQLHQHHHQLLQQLQQRQQQQGQNNNNNQQRQQEGQQQRQEDRQQRAGHEQQQEERPQQQQQQRQQQQQQEQNNNYQEISPLIKPGEYPTLRIDPPTSLPVPPATSFYNNNKDNNIMKDYALDVKEDVYAKKFHQQLHYNYIGVEGNGDPFVVSVLASVDVDKNVHRALITDKKGYSDLEVLPPNGPDDPSSSSTAEQSLTLSEQLEDILKKTMNKELYWVHNTSKFAADFVKYEAKHPQKRTAMKLGLVYCKAAQTEPKQMFLNSTTECSEAFWSFIKTMAKQIDLSTWKGYRGDMSDVGTTYHQNWHNIDIIYHVAPLLDAEGHRRLIGNDIAVIFFMEEGKHKFDPSFLDQLGTVPQIFAVVQPVADKFRVAFLSRIAIKQYTPAPPSQTLDINQLREVLLTKLHNGLVMANYCPPMNRLFYVPRLETLRTITQRYPMETRKDRERRLAKEKKKKGVGNSGISNWISEMNVTFENDATQYSMINALVLLVASNLAYLEQQLQPTEIPKQLGISPENMRIFSDNTSDTQGYIAHDDEKMIIALAGTKSLRFTRKPFDKRNKAPFSLPQTSIALHGFVRNIFANGIYAIWDEITGYLTKLNIEKTKKKIWICGYCAGGALATLLAHVLLQPQLPWRNHIAGLYTYGCPPIGDEVWSKTFDLLFKRQTCRVVIDGDEIPYIVPKPGKLHHVGVLYYIIDGHVEKDYKKNPGAGSLDFHTLDAYFQVLTPHHRQAVEARGGHTRDRVYSTVHKPHWMMEAEAVASVQPQASEQIPEEEDTEDLDPADAEARLAAKRGEMRRNIRPSDPHSRLESAFLAGKGKTRPVRSVKNLFDEEEEKQKLSNSQPGKSVNIPELPPLPNPGNTPPIAKRDGWVKISQMGETSESGNLRIGARTKTAGFEDESSSSEDADNYQNAQLNDNNGDDNNDNNDNNDNIDNNNDNYNNDMSNDDDDDDDELYRPRAVPFSFSDPIKLKRVDEKSGIFFNSGSIFGATSPPPGRPTPPTPTLTSAITNANIGATAGGQASTASTTATTTGSTPGATTSPNSGGTSANSNLSPPKLTTKAPTRGYISAAAAAAQLQQQQSVNNNANNNNNNPAPVTNTAMTTTTTTTSTTTTTGSTTPTPTRLVPDAKAAGGTGATAGLIVIKRQLTGRSPTATPTQGGGAQPATGAPGGGAGQAGGSPQTGAGGATGAAQSASAGVQTPPSGGSSPSLSQSHPAPSTKPSLQLQLTENNNNNNSSDILQPPTSPTIADKEDFEFIWTRLRTYLSHLITKIKQTCEMDIAANRREFLSILEVHITPIIKKLQLAARHIQAVAKKAAEGIPLGGKFFYDAQKLTQLETKIWGLLMSVAQFLKVAKNISETGLAGPESMGKAMAQIAAKVRDTKNLCEDISNSKVKTQ